MSAYAPGFFNFTVDTERARRTNHRLAMRVPCRVRPLGLWTTVIPGESVNVSATGLAIHVGNALPVGIAIEVMLIHTDGEPTCWCGRVVYSRRVATGTFLVGIRIDTELRETAPSA